MLMPLVAIVAMALPLSASAQDSCTIRIVGEDSYGDGWNGGTVTVTQSGSTVATFTLSSGYDDSTTVTVTNAPLTITWTAGNYDSEVTLWIYHSSGVLLYSATQPTAGTLLSMSNPCTSCFAPAGVGVDSLASDAARIAWSGAAASYGYLWGTTADMAAGTGTSGSTSSTSLDLTGLTSGTGYTVKVWSECSGETSDTVTYTFATLGDAVSDFPYSTGFEADDDIAWTFVNDATNKWFIGTGAASTGTNGLYISNDNGTTNGYTVSGTQFSYAYRVLNVDAATQFDISFSWKANGESNYDYIRAWIAPAVAASSLTAGHSPEGGTSAYNYTTATPAGWIDLGGKMNGSSSWQTAVATPSVAAGDYILVFMWANDGSGGSQPPAAIDNILITPLTCPAPIALVVDTLTAHEITVSWSPSGSESEWVILVNDSLVDGVTDTTYTISSLESYTQYSIAVAAVCDADDTSYFTSAVSARTLASCPWPTGLTADYVGTDTIIVSWHPGAEESAWLLSLDGDTPMSVTDTTYIFEGLNANTQYTITVYADCGDEQSLPTTLSVRTACGTQNLPLNEDFSSYASSSYPSCWTRVQSGSYPYVTSSYGQSMMFAGTAAVIAPYINAPLNQMIVSFDLRKEGSSSGQMTFGYTSDPVAASDMVVLQTIDPSTTGTYFHYEYDLSTDTNLTNLDPDSVYYLVWRQSSTSTVWYYWMDNVYIEQFNPCAKPQNFICTSTQPDSVVVTWNAGDATSWEIYVGPAGVPVNEDSAIAVTDSVYFIDNLQGGVAYDFYVRTDCSGEYSNWAGPLTVTPGQYVIGTSGSATITMCGGVIYDDGGANGQYSNNADFVLTIYPSHPDSMLTFQGWAYTEGSIDYLRIYEGTSPSGNQLWGTSTSSQLDSIPYTVVTSGPITLKWHTDVSIIYDGFELQIGCMAAPECSPVDALTVNPTPTAALVTWQPGYYGNYSGATVEYKVDTVDSWTALAPVTGNYAVITGLDPLTSYSVRVTTDCDGFMGGVATANFTTKQFSCLVEDTTQVTTGTIGTGTSETSGVPVNSAWGNTMCQSIYLASELTAMGMGNTITSITYTWTNNSNYAKEFSIYMTNTSASEFTSASTSNWQPTGATALVYNGQHPVGTSGSVTYQLATPFVWDGSSNICITTTMNQPAGASHTSSGFYGKSTETSPQVYRTMYKYQDSSPLDGSNPASVTPSSRSYNRPNITLSSSGCSQYGTCAAPAVAVTEVTTSTATLAWAPGNTETSWNLYYRMAGETNWSAPVAVTGNSYTVNSLTQGRKYEFKLENACTEGNFASIAEATLLCASISSLPFTENFNGWGTGVTPNCWSNAAGYSPASYGIISGSYNCSGTTGGSVYMYSSSTLTNKTYLALPELDTLTYSVNQLQLAFNLYHYSTSNGNPAVEVGVMTDPANASTFVTVDTARHSGALNTWEVFEVPLASYTGNGSYIAIRTAYEGTYSYFYLDDVTLEVIPTCPRPDSLTASNSTTSSVDLGWHERGGANSWIIEYGPRGFQPGTGTTVTANSNPFTLTGLPAAFQGEYYVKSICGAGDTGDYSRRPCALETTQIPATLPYNYDFESVTEWQNWQTSTNHATNNWYRGNSVADSGSYAMYIAAGDTATYGNYSFNAVVNAAAYRDIDFGPVDSSYTLSFRARVGGTTTAAYDGLMVFLVDPSIATVASTQGITSPWGNVNDLYRIATVRLDTTWQTYEASFDTISGVHRVAFFWFNQNTGASYTNIPQPAAVDNIHIRYSSCVRPLNVEVTPGSTTAHVTWQGASDGNYEVIYRQYPGDYTNSYANTATNSITLTGLESNSQYAVWVRKVCGVGDTSLTSDGILFTTTMCEGGSEAINFDPNASATTSSYSPIGYSTYNNSYVQTIVDSADLAALNGDITALGFLPTVTTAGDYFTNMTVYMANVPESTLTDFIHPDSTNHVFVKVIDSANFNYTEAAWQIHNLDNAFTWDGHSNLLVAVTREHGTWSSGATFSAHTASGTKMVYDYDDYSAFDVNTASGGTTSSTVGDIRLISCGAFVPCTDPVINLTATVANENDVTISFSGDADQYEVGYVQGNTWVEPATTVNIIDTFYTFTGLTAETQYTFGVRARCSETNLSNWSTVTISTAAHPCFTPTQVSVMNRNYEGATVSWTPGENETEWEVNVSCVSPVFNQTYSVSGTAQYEVTGLDEGVTYQVCVRGVCATGYYSDWSDTVDLTTWSCDVIENVHETEVTANSISVTWTATGATTYEVDYGDQGHVSGNGQSVTTTTNSITLNGLESESTYDIYVRQLCTETLTSQWSAMLRVTTDHVGIADVQNAKVTLFPNPASQMVTIDGIEGEATVSVVDMNGREVFNTNANETLTIDLTGYAKGAYFVRITGERTQAIRKLIVK